MSLVLNADKLAGLRKAMAHPRFKLASEVSARFPADPDRLKALLPPGLELSPEPAVFVRVGRFTSNLFGPYLSGGVQVTARHRDIEGRYVIALFCNSPSAVAYGRDFFGEPKKEAMITYKRTSETVEGSVVRDGVELIRVEGRLAESVPAPTGTLVTFNYLVRLRWNNASIGSVTLTAANLGIVAGRSSRVLGTAKVRSTTNDPLAEVPICGPPALTLFEGELDARVVELEAIDPRDYEPFAFGRYDNWTEGGD